MINPQCPNKMLHLYLYNTMTRISFFPVYALNQVEMMFFTAVYDSININMAPCWDIAVVEMRCNYPSPDDKRIWGPVNLRLQPCTWCLPPQLTEGPGGGGLRSLFLAGLESPLFLMLLGRNRKRAVAKTTHPNIISIMLFRPPSGAVLAPGRSVRHSLSVQ